MIQPRGGSTMGRTVTRFDTGTAGLACWLLALSNV